MSEEQSDSFYVSLVGKVCLFQLHSAAMMMLCAGADSKTPGILHDMMMMRPAPGEDPRPEPMPKLAPILCAKLIAANTAHFIVEYADMGNVERVIRSILRRDLVTYVSAVGEERLVAVPGSAPVIPIPPAMMLKQHP